MHRQGAQFLIEYIPNARPATQMIRPIMSNVRPGTPMNLTLDRSGNLNASSAAMAGKEAERAQTAAARMPSGRPK